MRPLQTYIGNPGEDRVAQIVERCEKAISRGLEWLAGRVSAEGELEGSETVLFGYYKALLTFTAAGRYLEAERAARKIKRDFYKDGQFGGEQYSAATVGPIYRDSWLTWGAHIAGRYDMSVPAACDRAAALRDDGRRACRGIGADHRDRKSTRLNSSH